MVSLCKKQEALLLQRDRARHLSVEILQLQNISLENPIVWHNLRDSMFSRFDTIPECDRHTQTDRQTDTSRVYNRVVRRYGTPSLGYTVDRVLRQGVTPSGSYTVRELLRQGVTPSGSFTASRCSPPWDDQRDDDSLDSTCWQDQSND